MDFAVITFLVMMAIAFVILVIMVNAMGKPVLFENIYKSSYDESLKLVTPVCEHCGEDVGYAAFLESEDEDFPPTARICAGCGYEIDETGKVLDVFTPDGQLRELLITEIDEKGRTPLQRVFEED